MVICTGRARWEGLQTGAVRGLWEEASRVQLKTFLLLVLDGSSGVFWLLPGSSVRAWAPGESTQPDCREPEPARARASKARTSGDSPVSSRRCTRTTCILPTASSTPLRRCFPRWGPNTPATWNSPPSTPPPRATWASTWASTSVCPLPHPQPCIVRATLNYHLRPLLT